MKFELSTGESVNLTPDQATLLLHMCDARENGETLTCLRESNDYSRPIRETQTASCLMKKGLAVPAGEPRKSLGVTRRNYRCTLEGYWLGDSLRILNRQGKLPERRTR